ncbi:hypothetical protein ACP4OV_007465 [Aristida adscensionis]
MTSLPLFFFFLLPSLLLSPSLSTASLRVVLRPQPHAPPSFPRSRADRFLVLSALSAAQLDAVASGADNGGGAVRLRVFFGGPYLLCLAADAENAAAVRLILRRQPHLLPFLEPEVAVTDAEQWAPLHAAAARGDCGEVRRLGPEALGARDGGGHGVRRRLPAPASWGTTPFERGEKERREEEEEEEERQRSHFTAVDRSTMAYKGIVCKAMAYKGFSFLQWQIGDWVQLQ